MRTLITLILTAPLIGGCFIFDDVSPRTTCGGAQGDTCADDRYCDYSAADACGAAGTGICKIRPTYEYHCEDLYEPVCGCDSKVYESECEANSLGISVLFTIEEARSTDVPGVWTGAAPGGWDVAWQFNADGTFVKYDTIAPCANGGTCPPWGTVTNRGRWSLNAETLSLSYVGVQQNIGGATTPATLRISGDCDAFTLRESGPSGDAIYTLDAAAVVDEHLDEASHVTAGGMVYFSLPVDVGRTVIVSTTSDSDVDLYVRMDAPPTTLAYDDRGFGPTGNETVAVTPGADGVLHIGVHGFEAGEFELTTSYPVAPPSHLDESGHVAAGQMAYYSLPVTAGRPVQVSTTAYHDIDLYVRMDAQPTISVWDQRGFGPTGDESLTVTPDFDGVLHIGVHGFEAGEFELTTRYAVAPQLDVEDKVDAGEMVYFTLPVLAGNGVVVTTTSDQDVDLYVRMGAAPTTSSWDQRGNGPTGDESLTVTPAADGVLHIGVYGYDAAAFQLTTTDAPDPQLDESGQVAAGQMVYYQLPVVAGRRVVVSTTSDADVDLYVRMDAPPTTAVYDQRGFTPTGQESVTVDPDADGVLHIGVHGFAAGAFQLTTSEPPPDTLDEADKVDAGEMVYYSVPVVAGRTVVVSTTADGDVDLYLRMDLPPTTSTWDLRAFTPTGNESITFAPTTDGVLHIGVHGYEATTFQLTTDHPVDVQLDESAQLAAGQMVHYTLPVVAGRTVVVTTTASADVDLYVRMDAAPTTSIYDDRAFTGSGDETLVVTPTADGVLHIGVHGFEPATFQLTTANQADAHLDVSGLVVAGEMVHYTLPVVAGRGVMVRTTCTEDVDLYVRMNAAPTTAAWDQRAFTSSGNEWLIVTPATSGVLHIGVHSADSAFFELTTGE